jgi:hypothetical protein
VLFAGCAAAVLVFGQAQISSGDIRGTVVDPSGAVIARATVTISDPDRGFTRSTQTDQAGTYSLPLLRPGLYRLRFEAPGFAVQVLERVEVRVGDTVVLNTPLSLLAVATEVTVDAEIPVVEPGRTQQANTIESVRIRNLPINRRNYLDFALLAPGVFETNDLVDGTDFRVVQAPQSGLSFGGGNGRGNAFLIDGVENYYNSGGVRPSISQEAVQEFQINRNTYSAEIGGAAGGAVNIISKSGTNQFHGNVFGFLRQRQIQARNHFDPGKSAFTRVQSGATAGGPVVPDETHYFAAFERLDRHETAFVPIFPDRSAFNRLTPSQQQLADFFQATGSPQFVGLAAAMRTALLPSPRTLELFDRNSGNFPFSEDNTQLSVRLDHRASERSNLFVRANMTKSFSQNAQFGALVAFNRGRSLEMLDGTVMVSHSFALSPLWVAETRAAFGYNSLDVQPTDPHGPGIDITGYGLFGREIFLPSTAYERHYQVQQLWNTHQNRHDLKFGVDINPVRDTVLSETFFAGRFSFGGRVPLGLVLNSFMNDPNFAANLGATLAGLGQARLVPNLQAPLTSLQSFNLGLPEFYQQGFGDPNWIGWGKRYNFFVQDSWRVLPSFTLSMGARYELEVNEEAVGTDPNNIAPRIGFAWTPGAGAKTVFRGGYGLYYSHINQQVPNVVETLSGTQIAQTFIPLTGIPGLNNARTGRPLTSIDIYQTLLAQGVIGRRQIEAADLAQFGVRPSATAPLSVVFGIVPDFVNPYAQQASFEIEHALGPWALSAGYNFSRGAHLVRILDRNLYYSGRRPDGTPTFGFHNPLLSQRNIFESTANSFYHALILQASKRFGRGFALNANYTWGKAIDEVTDFNTDFQPHDQLNARAERARSSFDQPHRFVLSAVLDSPLAPGRGKSLASNILGGFTFAPVVVASTGRPFNVLAGVDNLGDRHSTTHRPLRAGRNIGRGPGFFTLDARIARKFPLGRSESRNLEFIAEGFNLVNRTNFKTLNNTVGDITVEQLPRPLSGRRGPATEPLSFTSAFDPRQFQVGVKINF